MWIHDLPRSTTLVLALLTGSIGLGCDTRESAPAPPPTPIQEPGKPSPGTASGNEGQPAGDRSSGASNEAARAPETSPDTSGIGSGTSGADDTGPDAGYRRDIERVCFAESRSGADQETGSARMFKVADWLGRNIESERGREFLVEFSRTPQWDKADFLERVAREAGLAECPLVQTWARAGTSG